jgi:hypothetical protein
MKTQPLTPLPGWRQRLLLNEDLNFLLTNRIPRRLLTQFIGWYSRIRSRWLTRWSIAVWRQFTELDLSDAAKNQFDSLHDCFTRELKPGARPLDSRADRLVSPVDALVAPAVASRPARSCRPRACPTRCPNCSAATPRWRASRAVST